MFARLLVLVAGIGLAALFVPDLAMRYLAREDSGIARLADAEEVSAPAQTGGSSVRLPMDPSGHFFGSFRINGRNETGLVDTGASLIAINLATARRLGISPSTLTFSGRVSTANGTIKAAVTVLDRVEIGGISVRKVEAVVLPDDALSGTLIGMSFMNRLSSYRVDGKALHLFR